MQEQLENAYFELFKLGSQTRSSIRVTFNGCIWFFYGFRFNWKKNIKLLSYLLRNVTINRSLIATRTILQSHAFGKEETKLTKTITSRIPSVVSASPFFWTCQFTIKLCYGLKSTNKISFLNKASSIQFLIACTSEIILKLQEQLCLKLSIH